MKKLLIVPPTRTLYMSNIRVYIGLKLTLDKILGNVLFFTNTYFRKYRHYERGKSQTSRIKQELISKQRRPELWTGCRVCEFFSDYKINVLEGKKIIKFFS